MANCTNEEPCRNCDICDMEPGGADDVVEENCVHGVYVSEIECEACADENECGIEQDCEHDEPLDQCKICNDY